MLFYSPTWNVVKGDYSTVQHGKKTSQVIGLRGGFILQGTPLISTQRNKDIFIFRTLYGVPKVDLLYKTTSE